MTKGAKSCSAKFKMPRKANEIVVEWWLESKDAGKRNRVNVKHIIGKLQEVAVGGEVVVKLSSRCYRVTVVDLLNWVPKQRQKRVKKKAPTEKLSTKVRRLRSNCRYLQSILNFV